MNSSNHRFLLDTEIHLSSIIYHEIGFAQETEVAVEQLILDTFIEIPLFRLKFACIVLKHLVRVNLLNTNYKLCYKILQSEEHKFTF